MPFDRPEELADIFRDPDKFVRSVYERLNALENLNVVFNGTKRPIRMSPHNAIIDLDGTGEGQERLDPPAAPEIAVTEDEANAELDIAITLNAEYDTLYVERGTDGVTFAPLANLDGNATSYSDNTVEAGTEYFYRVRGEVGSVKSDWSNIDSGQLGECEYELPDDMGSSTAFKQGFVGSDYSDPNWNGNMQSATTSIAMSENGRKIIVTGDFGVGQSTRVLTREDDDSFTCEVLHSATGSGNPYLISRNGIIAGSVSNQSAVWLSGATSAPTIDATVNAWKAISPDGTKLYGVNDSGEVIERTVGGSDVVIAANCWELFGVSHCGDVVVLGANGDDPLLVYKKLAGTWTHTATLADAGGDTEASSACVGVLGDGTKAFGSNDAGRVPYFWDLTGTGTINATAMGKPADDLGTRCLVTAVASSGNLVVGEYEYNGSGPTIGAAIYWLASEGFAAAHNLDDYLTSAGITGMGNASGEYFSLDTTRCSANGTQFAYRCQKGPSGSDRNLFFAAVPAPT